MTGDRDWQSKAQEQVDTTFDRILTNYRQYEDSIDSKMRDLSDLAYSEDPDASELRDATDALTDELIDLGDAALDWAYDVRRFKTGRTLRHLRGKEPLNASTEDGGARHDAGYGAQAQTAAFDRRVAWPLDLSEWDKEEGGEKPRPEPAREPHTGRPAGPPPKPQYDPVVAKGTAKYTRRVGGVEVYLVVDERTRKPPI